MRIHAGCYHTFLLALTSTVISTVEVTLRIYSEFTFTFSFAKKFDKHLTFGGIVCIMNKYDYGSMIDVEALL